jgi:hypothetical protein
VRDPVLFAGQNVGVTQMGERIWLVTFMRYDLGYFDDETCRLEPIDNPLGTESVIRPLGIECYLSAQNRPRKVVGATGFEPATPCAQGRCATRLRYAPTEAILRQTIGPSGLGT